jgi:hypothetical protein
MVTNELVIDAFERVKEVVHETVEGLAVEGLMFRPTESANSIAWLIWHLTRTQDDHIADAARKEQVWSDGWYEQFGLPFEKSATGFGHTPSEVGTVQADAKLLLGYYDAVHAVTIAYVGSLQAEDYEKAVDERWDPPVTLTVRLVSVLSDELQHAGQAAYIRGLLH